MTVGPIDPAVLAYRDRLYENEGLPTLVDLVSPGERRVLDVGCGNGANMALLAARGHEPVGVTLSQLEARVVRARGFPCVVADIGRGTPPLRTGRFDAIVFSHVLEHLAWPEGVLRRWGGLLRPGGRVYVALPNAVQFLQRWQFLRGRFRYTETGIMDRTHLRFFDLGSARELVERAGFTVVHHFGRGMCPVGFLRQWTPGFSERVDRVASWLFPGFFGIHLVVVGCLPAGARLA